MSESFGRVYDALLGDLPRGETAKGVQGEYWSAAGTQAGDVGFAMTTRHDFVPRMFPDAGMCVPCEAVRSWNLDEASLAMAAINARYNTERRMEELCCAEPYDNYCTAGLDLAGQTVALIGRLRMPPQVMADVRRLYILERHPAKGDYPDSACDELLPRCDTVLITGSTLVNKTLPHLLELCASARVILTGPTVPMCPALLELGIDRLAGLVITERDAAFAHAASGTPGPPYRFGRTFLLKRD